MSDEMINEEALGDVVKSESIKRSKPLSNKEKGMSANFQLGGNINVLQ